MYFEENLVLIPLFMYKNFFKPLIGILLSFFGLMVCCIPMIIIAITIKLDSKGPIMFRQVRLGKGQGFISFVLCVMVLLRKVEL